MLLVEISSAEFEVPIEYLTKLGVRIHIASTPGIEIDLETFNINYYTEHRFSIHLFSRKFKNFYDFINYINKSHDEGFKNFYIYKDFFKKDCIFSDKSGIIRMNYIHESRKILT